MDKGKIIIAIGIILVVCFVALLCRSCGRYTTSGGNGNDVNRTMGVIEADNLGAGRTVRDAGDAIDSGQRELKEAADRINECETILEDSAERADRREAILEDCRRNLARAEQIVETVERANKERAKHK